MKKLTAVIIDDERLSRVSLARELSGFHEIYITGEASSIQTAIKVIEKLTPDILFLDIQLSDGREYLVLENIGEWQKKLPDEHFARIHRNSIINFNYIDRPEKTGNTAQIYLKNISEPTPISSGYNKQIQSRYFHK